MKEYKIKIPQKELDEIVDFPNLVEDINSKFDYQDTDDCSSQQAFYKLRVALNRLNIGDQNISPSFLLEDLLPRKNRIKTVKTLEKELGFKLNILQSKGMFFYLAIISALSVLVLAFFNFYYAFFSGIFLYSILETIYYNGKEFKIETVGELTKKMTLDYYFKVRRNQKPSIEKNLKFI